MGTRGRKSAASLAVAAPAAVKVVRPEPPYELWRDEEHDVWRRIVADVPPDWFTPRHHDLLAEYCTAVVSCRRLAQLIHHMEATPGTMDQGDWLALMRAHAVQSGRVQALATSMRLTQQSTYGARAGKTALDGHRPGPRPWEHGAAG